MFQDVCDFMESEDVKGSVSINTLIKLLEEESEDDLVGDLKKVMGDLGLLGTQRVDTLLLALAESEEEDEDEEAEADEDDDDSNED